MNRYQKICLTAIVAGTSVITVGKIIYDKKQADADYAEKKAEVSAILLAETLVKMKLINGDYQKADITPQEDWEFFKMLIRYAD